MGQVRLIEIKFQGDINIKIKMHMKEIGKMECKKALVDILMQMEIYLKEIFQQGKRRGQVECKYFIFKE